MHTQWTEKVNFVSFVYTPPVFSQHDVLIKYYSAVVKLIITKLSFLYSYSFCLVVGVHAVCRGNRHARCTFRLEVCHSRI